MEFTGMRLMYSSTGLMIPFTNSMITRRQLALALQLSQRMWYTLNYRSTYHMHYSSA